MSHTPVFCRSLTYPVTPASHALVCFACGNSAETELPEAIREKPTSASLKHLLPRLHRLLDERECSPGPDVRHLFHPVEVGAARHNASPCHRMSPRVCVLAAGHEGPCDDDPGLMQFVSGGDGGRYA